MRVTRIRTAVWIGVLVLTLGSFASIVQFYRTDYTRPPLSAERVNEIVRSGVESVRADAVRERRLADRSAYDQWWKFNALGIERAPEPAPDAAKPEPKTREPLGDLVTIAQILVLSDPQESRAYLEYVRQPGKSEFVRPGQTLAAVDAEVKTIDVQGVLFEYGGDEVRLRPERLFTGRTGPAGSGGPGAGGPIAAPTDVVGRPGEPPTGGGAGTNFLDPSTLEESTIHQGVVYVAPKDATTIVESGEQLLDDLSLQTHNDPQTRAADGIELGSVDPGGLAAKFGLQPGDVLKSIDGVDINSQAALVNFIKQRQGQKTFNVVIMRMGRDIPMTIRVP